MQYSRLPPKRQGPHRFQACSADFEADDLTLGFWLASVDMRRVNHSGVILPTRASAAEPGAASAVPSSMPSILAVPMLGSAGGLLAAGHPLAGTSPQPGVPTLTPWSRLALRLHPDVTQGGADHDSVHARMSCQHSSLFPGGCLEV